MIVNTDKTQILHFRLKKVQKTNFRFHLGGNELLVVNNYKYLGFIFDQFMDKHTNGNGLADGASRALGKLLSKYYSNKGLAINTYTKLYEACVCPIMDYCSGVWGYSPNDKIHKVHMRAIRCFLGVNRYAAKAGMEGELG